ncbi:MAG: hypothetical protein AAB874_02200 [Patescibacteria group bacterium]
MRKRINFPPQNDLDGVFLPDLIGKGDKANFLPSFDLSSDRWDEPTQFNSSGKIFSSFAPTGRALRFSNLFLK